MMRILIIGATGGVGKHLVKQSLEKGYSVTALVRNPDKLKIAHRNLTIIKGNILDPNTVDNAVKNTAAVISALGHKRYFFPGRILSQGTKNIIDAMRRHEVKRFICITSMGISDSRLKLGLYYTLFVIPFITFFYFIDKERQEKIIKNSSLDWTIIRPGQLTNGRQKGKYRHGPKIGSYLLTVMISRADVAEFTLKQLTDNRYLHKTPSVAN